MSRPLPSGEIAGRAVTAARPVAGGDINDAYLAELEDGTRAFVKTRAGGGTAEEYAAEAAGLRWLAEPGALRVPAVVEARADLLALEPIETGGAFDRAGEEELGRGLARLHRAGAPAHGALPPGAPEGGLRLAGLVLPSAPAAQPEGAASDDWPAFYAARRLEPLVRRAREQGSLSPQGAAAVRRVCERIHDLAGPPEPPARLHGDLWRGNVLAGADGRPWLIDPAAYGGHREVDLAMLELFGMPGDARRIRAAYQETWPLAPGHEDRVALYQLFPLLVHAVLFGGGYGASVERAAGRYR